MMNKITRWLGVGICATALTSGLTFAQTPTAANRQKVQQARIRKGLKSGSLTRPEARRLERNARRIHGSVVRDRRDGGAFTSRERIKAQKRLNRQSRRIHRLKHDAQTR